jgi:NTP pyrophosphatase (non-canonical NTP hydrolase)
MQGKEYVALAMRTNDGKGNERLSKKLAVDGLDVGGVLNGCLGLAGEAGETLDMIKKWVFHEKELDIDHLEKELGDVMWYVAMICYSFGFDLDEIMQINVNKLKARYPEGFDTDRSNHRAVGDV